MKFVIQRVTHATVTVKEKRGGEIKKGFVVLIGIGKNDTQKEADYLVKKLTGLRIFEDECRWKSAADISVYPVCKLQSGQSSKFYRGG